ncbi:hypothetical protein Emed_001303 [Eimeria media]
MHAADGPPTNTGPSSNSPWHFPGSIFHHFPAGHKQSAFWSYSFRNNEGVARPWGANDAEEKEDNSESDEEEDTHQNKCLTVIRQFIRAVFPHFYPLIWLVLPFVVCAGLFVAAYGDFGETGDEKLLVFVRNASSSTMTDIEDSVVKELSRRELMQQGLVVLVFISLMNALAWICCMLIRAILLTFIVNAGLYEQQTVSSLLTTIDPELFYFIWSVAVFLFWQQNLSKGRFYAVPAVDTSQAHQQLYWSPCFGSSMFVNGAFADILKSICQVTVLLATRRLVQSIMVFCFELGFMANMSSQLGKYLTKYAALRKLNTRCDEMSQDEDERMRLDQCFDELRRGRSITSAASRVSRYSRFSRHPSLRVPLRAMPSLVKEEQEQSPPRLPNQFKSSRSSKAPKDIGIRFVARAVRANYFRFRFQVNQNIQARELRGQGIPSQLTRSSIERIKQSKIHHWVLLQYVAVFPPAIFLHGRRIELDSKATARSVATSLFAALAADAAELAHDSQPKEPPYQKARGGAFGDGLQQSKQAHAPEHERTVTWLGSPDLQKTVPLDPVEECIPTSATVAGPTTTDPCVSGSLGDNGTLAPPNNSTNSTEPAADGGARADSPSAASDLLPPAAVPVAEETTSRTPVSEADAGGDKEPPSRLLGGKLLSSPNKTKETGQRGSEMLGPPPAASGNGILEKPLLQQPASNLKPCTKDALPAAASETQQPITSEDKGNAEGSGEESEPLEYLEGSFEFSVGQANGDGQARTTRRGRTQHIATLTPFNIAIRSPSVDVDAEVEGAEASFTADQQQGTAWPSDSFAIDVHADKKACLSSKEKKQKRRNKWGASLGRIAGDRRAATRASQKQEVELAGVLGKSNASCYSAAIDEKEGLCSSHSENGSLSDGGSFPASLSLEEMSLASSSITALRRGPEEDEEQQQRPQRVARGTAVLGAININSSLFNDGDFGTIPFPKGGPTSAEPGVGNCASPSNETGGGRRLLDPNNAGEEEYGRRMRYGPAQPAPEYFTRAFVEMFLRGDEVDEFMKQVDLAGHGKINQSMLKRAVISIYKMRKALLKSLTSQASICKTVRRMISIVLWAATLVAMLLVFGVNLNTVVVSGAAAISALTVALSYIYQNFITAVIYVAFTNPYNVGDRIRVDGGEAMYVRNIHTYTTEFVTVHGKPVVYSNTVLFGRQLMNESRSTNATFSMPMRLDIRTQLQSLRFLEAGMRKAIATRPMDFVKDSFSIYITDVQPGRYMDITVWLSSVEGWGNWPKVFRLRTDMYLVLQRLCIRLGISYQEPLLPVHLSSTQPPPSNGQTAPLGPGHSAHGAANGTSSVSLATLPELEGGQCFRGAPPAPSGVPLNALYCEPSTLQPFSTSQQNWMRPEASHAHWLPSSASSSRREERYQVEEERHGLQPGAVWDSPKNRRRGGAPPSHSSAASQGRRCSSDRSSVSSWEAENNNEGCDSCRKGSCEHSPLRRSAPISNADCRDVHSAASPLRTALSSEFVRAACGGPRPRRRHRNTAAVGGC